MDVKLFPETSEVADLIKHFLLNDEDKCVEIFEEVALKMSEEKEVANDMLDILSKKILEEVAFYPAKPLVLQTELERLGVGNSLAVKLSSIWSKNAKKIVTAKRKVPSDLKRVDYQVLRDIKTQEQTIKLLLTDIRGQTTTVTFTPSEMYSLYEHLEGVQSSIDSICK